MATDGTRQGEPDPPVEFISADGRNNARLAVPIATFSAAGVRLSEDRRPVERSKRPGHVEVVLGAASSRYVADIAGLPSRPREWPKQILGVGPWIAGAVPHAWRRIDTERRLGQPPRRRVHCGDLARARGDDEDEVCRRYRASAAPSVALPGHRSQSAQATKLLADPQSARLIAVLSRFVTKVIPDQRPTAGDRWGVTSPGRKTLIRVNCGVQEVFWCRRGPGGDLVWRIHLPVDDGGSGAGQLAELVNGRLGTKEKMGPPVNRALALSDDQIDKALETYPLIVAARSLSAALTSRPLLGRGTHNHDVYELLQGELPTA